MTIGTTPPMVRRAAPADAAIVQKLLLELADHEASGQHVRVDVERWAAMLVEPRVVVLLAEISGEVVGYVSAVRKLNLWLGRDILELDDLYVVASARNHRVGEHLMLALATHAAPDRLLIRWEMEVSNDGARRFYERLGATVKAKNIAVWRPHDYTATPS